METKNLLIGILTLLFLSINLLETKAQNDPCQDFTLELVAPAMPVLPDTAIYHCLGEDLVFQATGVFPNNNQNYVQSNANLNWTWSVITIDGVEFEGLGMTTLEHEFLEPGGYYVGITAEDQNGCIGTLEGGPLLVYVSVPPTIEISADTYEVCPGETVNLSGSVQVDSWAVPIPTVVNECFCAADIIGVPQCAEFTYNQFAVGQQIESVDDIGSLCMDLEHSYVGDLDLWIECPNGSQVNLLSYPSGCGGDYFGEPIDNGVDIDCDDDATIGVLYTYCWSSDGDNTIAQECAGTTGSLPEGEYVPEGNFNGLIGCPVNGTWKICFQDNLNADDGIVCDFVLQFDESILPGEDEIWSFQNVYEYDRVEWLGDGMGENTHSGTEIVEGNGVANPTIPGEQTFTFSVTDDFGCTYTEELIVNVLETTNEECCVEPETNAGFDDLVCELTYTFDADIQNGNTGSWRLISGPGEATFQNQQSPNATVTVTQGGTYLFEWTEVNTPPACIDSDTVVIELYQTPTSDFSLTEINCYREPTIATYEGVQIQDAEYMWTFDGGVVAAGGFQGPYELFWEGAGPHDVTLQVSVHGCLSDVTTETVFNPEELTHILLLTDDPCYEACKGKAEVLVVGGLEPFEYSWTQSPETLNPVQLPALTIHNNLCKANYELVVTDANGCTSTEDFVIGQPLPFAVVSTYSTNVSCFNEEDGTIEINAVGGEGEISYIWSDIGYGSNERENLSAGMYCVTVQDENGCSENRCIEITQPQEFVTNISPNVALCEGDVAIVQANASGGTLPYTYYWDQGNDFEISGAILNLNLGETTPIDLYVVDANGCYTDTLTTTVKISPRMVINSMNIENSSCNDICDGSAEIVMSGGIPPFNYSWGVNSPIFNGLCAGDYTVTVTDLMGCKVSESFEIQEPLGLTSVVNIEPVSCFGNADGEASVFIQGGLPPYEYLWPNGSVASSMTIGEGNYAVTVSDANNCRLEVDVTVTEPEKIYVKPIGDREICKGQSVMLTTQISGGTPYNGTGAYDFSWQGSDGSTYSSNHYTVNPEETTNYTLVVTDANGCTSENIVSEVFVYPDLEILSLVTSYDTICPGEEAIVYVDVQGGNGGPYMMSLQDGRVVPSPFRVSPKETTTYYVQLADMCGSPAVKDSITINVRDNSSVVFSADIIEGCSPLEVQFSDENTVRAESYLWQFGDGTFSTERNPIHTYQAGGTYTVGLEVEDEFGCKIYREMEDLMTIYPGPISHFEINPEIVSILDAQVEFINLSEGADTYYWAFGDGESSTQINPRHTYTDAGTFDIMLVAESPNSCTDTSYRKITVNNEYTFYAPTTFSPNNDGINDCFRPCGVGIDTENFMFTVYDRWGIVVYTTNRFIPSDTCDECVEGAWNGAKYGKISPNGSENMPNGVYQWECKFYDFAGNLREESGTVSLVR